jgi:Transposase IS116/IS110/IS902 family
MGLWTEAMRATLVWPPYCYALQRTPGAGAWRPPSLRSNSTGWSVGSPPNCSASWESVLSWPVSSSLLVQHRRIRSEAAFSKLGGAAPIEASPRTVTQHRLNMSGDRQLNRALHTIVLVRMHQDRATKD